MITVLVTGGAGYIGAHALRALKGAGYGVVVLDNFSRGHCAAAKGFTVIEGDIADRQLVRRICREYAVEAVMHFAAHSQVGESVEKPALYYENNVIGGLCLLEALREAGVKWFVFSSSAAVYGEPEDVPIDEEHPLRPQNPYGESKLVLERALGYYRQAYGFQAVSLRYFNAAGAAAGGEIGEDHDPETHLIPLALQAVLGQREKLVVFGNDYPTPDGTAVRDYIHVDDLAQAHLLALKALVEERAGAVYNLGNGQGYSVLEVLKSVERVTGKKVPYEMGPRRAGDPAVLVASAERAERELGWRPKFTKLDDMVSSAWEWHRKRFAPSPRPSPARGEGEDEPLAKITGSVKASDGDAGQHARSAIIASKGIWKGREDFDNDELRRMRETDFKKKD
jgi:UDP-glucose-4-epimerase GalE